MLDHVDIDSSVAVYVQIENHVQFAIASGRLKPGDQLPPVRELAERLGANQNTVEKAYRELEILGLVYTRRGVGAFINKHIEAKCREECHGRIVSRLHEVVAEAKAAGMTGKEVREVVEKSFATETSLYGKTPAEMLALAKDPGAGARSPLRVVAWTARGKAKLWTRRAALGYAGQPEITIGGWGHFFGGLGANGIALEEVSKTGS